MKRLIIFTDIGDTIIDENTEVRDSRDTVIRAECIPGAKETYLKLHEAGFAIVMVADGTVESFHNTMTQHGLSHIFAAEIISEAVGEDKPSAKMFEAAMRALDLTDADKSRVIMVGNNVKRDILGANRFGIRSVLIDCPSAVPLPRTARWSTPTIRSTHRKNCCRWRKRWRRRSGRESPQQRRGTLRGVPRSFMGCPGATSHQGCASASRPSPHAAASFPAIPVFALPLCNASVSRRAASFPPLIRAFII